MMHRLVYSCHATRHIAAQDLASIQTAATRRNASLGVSGILLYGNRRFVQVLEGKPGSVFDLLWLISADERASALRIEAIQRDVSRIFTDWAMRVVDASNGIDPIGREFNNLINLFVTARGTVEIHEELNQRCETLRELAVALPQDDEQDAPVGGE
ncbi:MAG: BLUF domain-containing protein [Phycisphaerales bacterium]